MRKHKKAFQYTVLALSVLLIAVGVSRGEVVVVLRKAITVCLECIGIG